MAVYKKRGKWVLPRHKFVKNTLIRPFEFYSRIRYGLHFEIFPNPEHHQYLILTNHQTPFDQFFTAFVFRDPIYYIATEDIFSIGFLSRLLEFVVAPIPIRKGATDVNSIKNCVQVVKEGGSIALCPEGNRTYSGQTESIKPSIAKLIKMLKLPVLFVKFEGGYGVAPRWSDVLRKGSMRAYPAGILGVDEIKAMSAEELAQKVTDALYVDEHNNPVDYHSNKRAEYLERLLYVCPQCGLTRFESKGNRAYCHSCELTFEYNPNLTLKPIKGSLPYSNIRDWYFAQNDFVRKLPISLYEKDEIIFSDFVSLYKVHIYEHKERMLKNAFLSLRGNTLQIEGNDISYRLALNDITGMSVLGHNKLGFYVGEDLYQIKGSKRFNAVKYLNLYYHYTNRKEPEKDGEFLGL